MPLRRIKKTPRKLSDTLSWPYRHNPNHGYIYLTLIMTIMSNPNNDYILPNPI